MQIFSQFWGSVKKKVSQNGTEIEKGLRESFQDQNNFPELFQNLDFSPYYICDQLRSIFVWKTTNIQKYIFKNTFH